VESVGETLLSLGVIFLAGLVFDTVGRRTPLPRVTLLMIFGFCVGPSALDLLPSLTQRWFPVVANIALVMVGFLLGGRLTRREFQERGAQVIRVSLSVVGVTFLIVSCGLVVAGAPLDVALILAAIATATDPAATVDVVHSARSDTPFARTLLDVVALDDAWGLIVFSLALALAQFALGESAAEALRLGAWDLAGALALGIGLGVPMAYLTGRIEPGEPTLYEALGLVFLCGGLALLLEVSFLLAAMTMGAVVANLARHHTRPFHAIEGIEFPFMIVFFVLAGASLDVEALAHVSGWLAAYMVLRIAGRLLGGWLGGRLPPADPFVRRWIGAALLPQAGVAIGMALVAVQHFPEAGETIVSVAVAATVLFEIIGPVATRLALKRSAESTSLDRGST
jgi:Kef-type K+ transport system membrane component KefB